MLKCYTQNKDYTFKFNKNLGRHGWLRLTPAYSVQLVKNILSTFPEDSVIFEPFSGTATTGLVCAEEGYRCHCYDINPFLVWLGKAKCDEYTDDFIQKTHIQAHEMKNIVHDYVSSDNWTPSLFKIDRWWSQKTLNILTALRRSLVITFDETQITKNPLPWIAFCRLIIETSSAAFNHVSMSFCESTIDYDEKYIINLYMEILDKVLSTSRNRFLGNAQIHNKDSLYIDDIDFKFDTIITSPPYPNRISYIRELRPYMYWTKFLQDGKEAGELDWKTIGGTWGVATSYLNSWEPTIQNLPDSFYQTVKRIKNTKQKNSSILAQYVLKYFHDMHKHFLMLPLNNKKDFSVNYIIGNSMFYGEMVDTPKLYCDSLASLGFSNIKSNIIRKRNCNKLLYEYVVSASYLN